MAENDIFSTARTILGSLVVAAGLMPLGGGTQPDASCEDLTFEKEVREGLNPVSLLEHGDYIFVEAAPLSRSCMRRRICQVNDFTRSQYSQSFYVSLNTKGGQEIERQFPDVVSTIIEARVADRNINLNNFCLVAPASDDRVESR